ncbi:MAG TPA: PBP1A family penicillin-binding protein [Thermoanaerobaculia bacterium]
MQQFAAFRRSPRDWPEMSPARRRLVIAALAAAALLFLGGFVLMGYLWRISRQFPQAPFAQPSRLYASVPEVAPGAVLSAAEMVAELQDAGYRETAVETRDAAGAALPAGAFRRAGDRVAVRLRRFPTPSGPAGGSPVEVAFQGGRVARVWVAGRPAQSAALEPPLLASFYDKKVEERRPVALAELPDEVVKTVLAAEDSGFFIHPGVSPTGIARALWVNLRGGEVQGGSTITQQLVKNVYLSSRRTLKRKAEEALIAMMLEVRHGKTAVLEAYLNEIYLGRSGPANVIGLGAAARAYFGKDAAALSLPEAATLAGMIESPATLSPVEHPEKAVERRNRVLQRMGELGWISKERVQQAVAEPLRTDPQPVVARPIAPYFAAAAEAEARERFHADDLDGRGYLLFATLRWRDQRQAESAVAQGLAGLEGGAKKARKRALQSALVSVDPRDGSVLAWVGGRSYERSQFDRVLQAHRQVGSAFKPVVYGAALAEGTATPATLLHDSPINVRVGTASWQPQNYDRSFHGWVTARMALEQSLNVPTVRVALQVGMPRVIALAREMGMTGALPSVPSLALGVFEATPYEMAEVYSTLAAGGVRPPLHALAAVLKPDGEAMLGDDLPEPKRVLPAESAYQVTSMLQGVLDHGTAAAARSQGVDGPLAGKTGTTSDRRDNWFAGYSPDRVSIVWVGYDDNSPTTFSGASAALPIWSRFTAAVRPARGYADFPQPPGMVKATVDPTTGQLATELCPYRVTELFAEWQAPTEPCQRHSPGGAPQQADVTLGQPLVDPETGQPVDPSATEEPRYAITDNGLQVVDAAGDAPAKTFPPHPVTAPGAPGTPAAADDGAGDGGILIRPTRVAKAPAPADEPANGVVGAAGQAIGKKAAPAPAADTNGDDAPPPP